jgi:very-short-patch-repair endonuclease
MKTPGHFIPLEKGDKGGFQNTPQNALQGGRMERPYLPYNRNLKQRSRDLRNESTLGEILLWKHLRVRQMSGFQFNRQKPLGRFIADFYCKPLNLVIEVDGSSHEGREEYDRDRDIELQKLGLTVLRFPDLDVRKNIREVLKVIEAWIERNYVAVEKGKSP